MMDCSYLVNGFNESIINSIMMIGGDSETGLFLDFSNKRFG